MTYSRFEELPVWQEAIRLVDNSKHKGANKVIGLLPAHGVYRELQSYQMSEICGGDFLESP